MIEKVTLTNLDEVLPLIREYQGFYGVEDIDDEKNKAFFSQFALNQDQGVLHLYRVQQQVVGFSTVYKGFSSTRAETVAILNDLFVQTEYRGKGYGKALLDHAITTAKSMGFSRLQWLTAESNQTAQRLYDECGAQKSAWFFYAQST